MTETAQNILQIINNHGPVKSTDISWLYVKEFGIALEVKDIAILTELVQDKLVIEIEYVLPQLPFRTKSMFFPLKTIINVIK